MESVNRAVVSDSEQSVGSYSLAVKEEPEWGECGASEAAPTEGLYAGHNIKYEIEIEPEMVQEPDIAFSMQRALNTKEDPWKLKLAGGAALECIHTRPGEGPRCPVGADQPAWSCMTAEREPVKEQHGRSEAAVAEGLYADHDVKEELVIGPELVQQQDIAFSVQSALNTTEEDPCKLKPAGGAGAAPECSHTRPGDLKRVLIEDLPACKTCLTAFDCKLSLTNHSCTNSVKTSNFYQEVCDETTGVKLYICNTCKKQFAHKSHLNNHIRIHTGEKQFMCEVCKKQFTESSHLTRHRRIHTGEKPFSCSVCNKQFAHKSTLTGHIQMHRSEKLYICDICKKKFSTKNYLFKHIRIHTGEKPFVCDVCKKQFITSNELNSHSRIHTGEKPYSCSVCSKKFAHGSNLTCHMRTHTGEKLYSCDLCEKGFAQKQLLTMHRRIHTGEKPFICDVCKKLFRHKSSLSRHKVLVHKRQP